MNTPKASRHTGAIIALLVALPTAAASILLWPGEAPRFVEHPTPANAPVELQATCGPPGPACRKGHSLYLRLVPRGQAGNVTVLLFEDGKPQILAGPMALHLDAPTLIPAKLMPEQSDVTRGLQLDTVFTAQGQTQATHLLLTLPVEE